MPSPNLQRIVNFLKKQGPLVLALFLVLLLPSFWFIPTRGLIATYYANSDWQGQPVFSQLEKRIGLETVYQRRETFPQRNFSVAWNGWIRIDQEGEYTFSTRSDDGSSLFIDDALVVDNGGTHAVKKVSGKIFLTRGIHRIHINYFQAEGEYQLSVQWIDRRGLETSIPLDLLYLHPLPRGAGFLSRNLGTLYPLSWLFLFAVVLSKKTMRDKGLLALALLWVLVLPLLWFLPPRGLMATYYDNTDWRGQPIFSQLEKQITLETVNRKWEILPQKDFSVAWKGWIRIDREGEYLFTTRSDDGSFIYLDDTLVVDNGGVHVSKKVSGKIFLTQGIHRIAINYFQDKGDYELMVSWAEDEGVETTLPLNLLYPAPPSKNIEALSRNLGILYPLSWLFFLSVLVSRRIMRERGSAVRILKQYAQNITLSLVTVLIFLILAEGAIRLISYIRENRKDLQLLLKESQETELNSLSQTYSSRIYGLKGIVQASPYEGIVYELKPNLNGYFRGALLLTNSRGLRDFEYSYRKKENTFRIVGLGDSSLFGWGVKMEDISLKVLERRLNQNSPAIQFEVINFATPGYNTAIEVEVFIQKCLKYSPDLVLMNFNTNDYDVPAFMKLPQDYSNLRKSYLFDLIYSRYQILKGGQSEEPLPFDFVDRTIAWTEADRLDEDPALPDEYRYMVGTKGYTRALNKLGEVARAHGIPVVQFDVISYPGIPDDPLYGPNPFRAKQLELITRLSQENGFFFLNTYPYYVDYARKHPDEVPQAFWVSPEDTHPSALAHEINADALYDFLVANKLIPLL